MKKPKSFQSLLIKNQKKPKKPKKSPQTPNKITAKKTNNNVPLKLNLTNKAINAIFLKKLKKRFIFVIKR